MTMAVCFKCGEIKFGAFCPCQKCGQEPKSEDDRVISMAITDHYFDKVGLDQISEVTRKNGKPPDLDPGTREQLLTLIRECEPMFSEMEKLLEEEMGQDTKKKPWCKLW